MRISEGKPYPLGATATATGANFAGPSTPPPAWDV